MKRKTMLVIASALVIAGLLLGLGACAPGPAPAAKTLKISAIVALNWPIGINFVDSVTMDVDKVNKAGGLDIGGGKYNIDLIVNDSKMDLALAKTAAEKAIYQDKVKFIISDLWCDSFIPLTEAEKVILVAAPSTDPIFNPAYKYCFHGSIAPTNFVSVITYCARKLPNLKTWVGVFPDRIDGRAYGEMHGLVARNSGLTVLENVFYPFPATDLSAVGTRIKALNPDFVSPHGGGPDMDSMALKAAHAAGWRGQIMGPATIPGGFLIGIAGAEAVEGMISIAWPAEFEPPTTAIAREFKADYTAKQGKWDDPEVVTVICYDVMKSALQQAGSLDPEKVAAVLNNGMKFQGIVGVSGQMIARPDKGVTRTIQCVLGDMPVKQLVGGTVKQIDTLKLEQTIDLVREGYAIK